MKTAKIAPKNIFYRFDANAILWLFYQSS